MLFKPLKEEQADMRARWSDPAYRWANDRSLREKVERTYNDRDTIPEQSAESSSASTSNKTEEGAREKSEGAK